MNNNVDAPDAAQSSMKPLQLLVGEGKNAKYIQGILRLQTSKMLSDSAVFLSFLRPLQPAQSYSWENKVCTTLCSPQYCPTNFACQQACLLQNMGSRLSSFKWGAQLPTLVCNTMPV